MSKYRALLLACLLCAACPPVTDDSSPPDGGPPDGIEARIDPALAECIYEKNAALFSVELLRLELAVCEGRSP